MKNLTKELGNRRMQNEMKINEEAKKERNQKLSALSSLVDEVCKWTMELVQI